MQLRLLVFSLLLVLPLVAHCQEDEPCRRPFGVREYCVCDTGNGIIDLTSMSYSNGDPFFSDYAATGGDEYFYNPCHSFTTGFSECNQRDIAVCQAYNGGSAEASCGTTSSENIVKRSDGYYYVLYGGGTDGRNSEVRLICDTTAEIPTFSSYGDKDIRMVYKFDLKTKCACPGMCAHQSVNSTVDRAQ